MLNQNTVLAALVLVAATGCGGKAIVVHWTTSTSSAAVTLELDADGSASAGITPMPG